MSSFETSAAPQAGRRFDPDPIRPEPPRFQPLAGNPSSEPEAPSADGSDSNRGSEEAPAASAPGDLDRLRRQAYEEGLEAGRAELPWREARGLTEAAEALGEAARALAELRRQYLSSHRRAIVELALAIAEKILARELRENVDALGSIVERAIEQFHDEEPVRVGLSAPDLEALQTGLAPALDRIRSEAGIECALDSALQPGDVRVRAGGAQVDARLPALLQRIRDELDVALEVATP